MNQTSNIERVRTCEGCFYFADLEGERLCMALPQPSPTSKNRTECSLFKENTYSGSYKKQAEPSLHTILSQGRGSGIGVLKPMADRTKSRPAIDLSGGRPERREMECECGETVMSMGVEFECERCERKWEVTQ